MSMLANLTCILKRSLVNIKMTTHVRFLLPHDLLWRTNQQPGTLFTDFQHIASRVTKKNYVCNFKTFVTAILF